jgi:hypothetical protein
MREKKYPEMHIITLDRKLGAQSAGDAASCQCDCDQTLPPCCCQCDCDQTLPPCCCQCDCDQTLPPCCCQCDCDQTRASSDTNNPQLPGHETSMPRTFFKIAGG